MVLEWRWVSICGDPVWVLQEACLTDVNVGPVCLYGDGEKGVTLL